MNTARDERAKLITGEGMSREIRKLADLAKLKADALDEAWLTRADPRAVQGGAICDEAHEWRSLARQLKLYALGAKELVD